MYVWVFLKKTRTWILERPDVINVCRKLLSVLMRYRTRLEPWSLPCNFLLSCGMEGIGDTWFLLAFLSRLIREDQGRDLGRGLGGLNQLSFRSRAGLEVFGRKRTILRINGV